MRLLRQMSRDLAAHREFIMYGIKVGLVMGIINATLSMEFPDWRTRIHVFVCGVAIVVICVRWRRE